MPQWSRRNWLRTLGIGAFGLLASGRRLAASGGRFDAQPASGESADLVSVMRRINNRQVKYKREHGTYGRLAQLPHGTVPGSAFEVSEELTDNGRGYLIVVREISSGHLMRTSNMGVIYETRSATPLAKFIGEFGASFEAAPITLERPTGANRFLTRVVDFFVPALYARTTCNCGNCLGPGDCPDLCYAICCNNGTASCTWCCPDGCCPE